jgi:MFS family permease
MTLLQATAITERWGATHYGRLSGMLSAPVTLTAAIAPWIGAALASALNGYGPMFLLMGGVALVAAVAGLASIPTTKTRERGSVV